MSTSVDNRVVQMSFKNEGFLSKVNETAKSLNILKTALNFSGVVKSEDLKLDTSQPESAIDKFISKINILGDASQKVFSLVSGAMANVGHTIAGYAEDLSIGQMMPGFEKYAKDTKSVQTIMFATGESIEKVEEELEKLMFFTDETSYSYENMVDNIGKFTSMKIPLDESRIAMQGIALAAAAAGQGSAEASRAMYNISQAMGAGAMKLMDWRSIENANMATAQLKERAIEAAKALGTLNKQGQVVTTVGTGKKAKKQTITVDSNNFAQTLSEGWFTKDVIMKVFSDYGEFAEKVQQLVDETGISTSDAIAQLSGTVSDFSEKAYKAGQEATTFREAIDAVRDAASTKWLQVFKMVFGNYEEAKVTWTKLANDLYEIFVTPLEGIVDLLKEWHFGIEDGLGSWNDFIQGAKDIMDGLLGILDIIKTAFAEIIPPITVEHLQKFSLGVKNLGAFMKETFGIEEEGSTAVARSTKKMTRPVQKATNKFRELMRSLREIDDMSTWLGETDDILKIGSKSEKDVKSLQKALKDLGYDLGKYGVDGKFGAVTEAALNAFKRDMGLLENGILDFETSRTLQGAIEDHLGLSGATKSLEKFNRELSMGMSGDDVKLLQERLYSLGYIGAKGITGVFDKKTKYALARFERNYGLVVDGIYNENDHELLDIALQNKVKATTEATKEAANQADKVVGDSKTAGILETLARGFASVLDIGRQVLATIGRIGGIVAKVFSPVADVVLSIAVAFSNAAEQLDSYLKSSEVLETFSDNVEKKLRPVAEWVENAANSFKIFFGLKEPVTDAEKRIHKFSRILEYFVFVFKLSGFWESVVKAFDRIREAIKTLGPMFDRLGDGVSNLMGDDWVVTVVNFLGRFVQGFLEVAGYLIEVLGDLIGFIIESIPGAIGILEGFWNALFFAGDEKAGKAPGIITSIIKWFKELFGITSGDKEVQEYAKTGEGTITKVTKAIAGETQTGGKRVNKVLDVVKGIVETIKKIFGAISLALTGTVIEGTGLSETTIEKINRIRAWFERLFAAIGFIFSGKTTVPLSQGFIDTATTFRQTVSNVFEFLKNTFGSIFATIAYFFTGKTFENLKIGDNVKKTIDNIKQWLTDIWNGLKTLFTGEVAEGANSDITDKAIWLRDKVGSIFEVLKGVFEGIFTSIGKFLGYNKEVETTNTYGSKSGISTAGVTIKSIFDTILNTISSIISSIINFITGNNSGQADLSIGERLKEAIKRIGLFFAKIVDAIELLITGDETRNDKLSVETVNRLIGWRDNIINVFKGIADTIGPLFSKIGSVLSILFTGKVDDKGILSDDTVNTILDFRNRIVSFFESLFGKTDKETKKDIKEIPKDAGTFKGLLLTIGAALGGTMGGISLITNIINKFREAVGLKKQEKNKESGIKVLADSLLKIAIAIGILVTAIIVLENVKLDKIINGIKWLAAIYGVITAAGAIIRRIQSARGISPRVRNGSGLVTLQSISDSILDIAKGVGILVASILVLAKMKAETFLSGLWKLALVLVEVGVFMWALKKIGFERLDIKGFWDLAAGILILTMAVKSLSDGTVNIHGLGALAAIMALVTGLIAVMGLTKATSIDMKGLISLASCVKILANVAKSLSDGTVNIDGIGALAAIMAMIAGVTAVIGAFGKDRLKVGPMLVLFGGISAAIYLFGEAIKKIKGTKPELLYAFSISLTIALGAFVAACLYVGSGTDGKRAKNMMKGAGAIAASIAIIVAAVTTIVAAMGGIDMLFQGGFIEAIERGGDVLSAVGKALEKMGPTLGIAVGGLLALSGVAAKLNLGPVAMAKGSAGVAVAIDILVVDLTALFAALGHLEEASGGWFSKGIDRFGDILESISTAIAKIERGYTKIYNEDLRDFGQAISDVRSGIKGISLEGDLDTDLTRAKQVAEDLYEFFQGIKPYNLDEAPEILSDYTSAASVLFDDIESFGKAIGSVRSGVLGISENESLEKDIDVAMGVVNTLNTKFIELLDLIDNSILGIDYGNTTSEGEGVKSGLVTVGQVAGDLILNITGRAPDENQVNDYNSRVSAIFELVDLFGQNLKDFRAKVRGFGQSSLETDTNAAIGVAQSIADFISNLGETSAEIERNKSGISKFFTGGTARDTVFDTVGKLAESISNSKDTFIGLSSTSIKSGVDTAKEVVMAVAGLLSSIGSKEIQNGIDSGMGTFVTLSGMFSDNKFGLGSILKSFAEQIKDTGNLPEVSDIIQGFNGLADNLEENELLQKEFKNTGISYSNSILNGMITNDVTSAGSMVVSILSIIDGYKSDFETVGKNYVIGVSKGILLNYTLGTAAANFLANRMITTVNKAFGIASPSKEGEIVGENYVYGVVNGLKNESQKSDTVASNFGLKLARDLAVSTAKTLRENSPSKVGAELGKYFVEGIGLGLSQNSQIAEDSASSAAQGMITVAQNTLATLYQLLNEGIDAEPTITPVVDLTNVRNAAGEISSTLGGQTYGAVTSQSIASRASSEIGRPVDTTVNVDASLNTLSTKFNEAIDRLNNRLDTMTEDIANMQMYIDGNTLVGYVSPRVNRALGSQVTMARRMN